MMKPVLTTIAGEMMRIAPLFEMARLAAVGAPTRAG
jgi:hypothetical protein